MQFPPRELGQRSSEGYENGLRTLSSWSVDGHLLKKQIEEYKFMHDTPYN